MRTAIVATNRVGDMDHWLATRAEPGDPFGVPSPALLAATNAAGSDELDPELSPDGLTLYLSYQRTDSKFLLVAERATSDAMFSNGATLYPVGPGSPLDSDPTIDPDELVLVFTRQSATTMGDLYVALRPVRDTPLGTPRPLSMINTANHEGDAELSADGCEQFFASDRAGGGDALYVARAAM